MPDTIQSISNQELYDELECVLLYWQQLDAEWRRRLIAAQSVQQKQKEIWTPNNSHDPVQREDDPTTPFVMPDLGSLLSPPSTPDISPSDFSGGGGESGGAGATGEW